MVPQMLLVRNFMCYRDDVPELKLDGISIACLSGENGAGKSALLDAITWVLWGKARMSDEELLAVGSNEMEVDLRFDLAGQQYRVLRSYQRGNGKRSGKGELHFQVRNGVGWKPLGELQKVHTQEQIIQLLRMKYETFINSAFLLQGRADEFTRKAPAERKQVLADILDLSEYARLEALAKERVKALNDTIKGLDGLIEHVQQEADKREVYRSARDDASVRVDDLSDALERAVQRLEAARERVREREDALRQQQERQLQADKLRREQTEQEQQQAELAERINAAQATLARADEIEAGVLALKEARAELERLEGLRDRFDELERERSDLQAALREALNELQRARSVAHGQVERLLKRAALRERLVAEVATLASGLVDRSELAAQRDRLLFTRAEVDARSQRQAELRVQREQLGGQIKLKQDSLVGTREELQRTMRRLDEQLLDEQRRLTDLAAAREQQVHMHAEEQRLATLRRQEQEEMDAVSDKRAECQRLKEQADQLKKYQGLLAPGDAICPVCRSELGDHGIEEVRLHYDEEIQAMRVRYAACKKEADGGDGQLKKTRSTLSVLEQQIGERRTLVARIEPLEGQVDQAARWRAEQERVALTLQSVQQQLAQKDYERAAQEALAVVEHELATLGDNPAALRKELETLDREVRTLDKRLNEQSVAAGQLQEQQRQLDLLDEELKALPDAEAALLELDRQIEGKDFAHDIRARGKEVVAALERLGYTREVHQQVRALAGELAHWQDEQQQLARASQEIELNRFRLNDLAAASQRRIQELTALSEQIAALQTTIQALQGAPAEREQTELAERKIKQELSGAQTDLGYKESLLKRATEAAAQLLERENERKGLLERQSVFAELAEAYGKKGLQAMLIETAIPEIEREANGLLARMTDNQMHVTVETQRETKKGDAQETLEIKIADALGTRAYDAFSGGELFRVNFAIRIALSKLLARRAGARLETLVIDEGFGALDARGRERLVEAISSVQEDFKRILVITHIQELKDLFPTQIEVTKTPEGSRWQLV